MEKVHLLQYPWVNGVVIAEVGGRFLVKFDRGDGTILSWGKLARGHLIEGLDVERDEVAMMMVKRFRLGATEAVRDEVADKDVGDV